jgi:biotin synthase
MVLLEGIKPRSKEMYLAMQAADQVSRRQFGNIGGVLAQIGVDWSPCPANCGFCAFAESSGLINEPSAISIDEVAGLVKGLRAEGATAISVMTTAGYPIDQVADMGKAIRKVAGVGFPLIANIGDLDTSRARSLVESGFTGIYHCVRLGEGKDTSLDPSVRMRTIRTAKGAGLMVFSCVEPIGPEHGPEEILDIAYGHLDLGVDSLATMRRTPVPGTPLYERGAITETELVRISSVIRLAAGSDIIAFGNHETSTLPLISGANTLTAEVWSNPRKGELKMIAGSSVEECKRKLWEAGWSTLN